jgi:hypothetical protein
MTEGRDKRPVPHAQRHLLLADLDGALYQLFSITFTRNGILVNFPYHPGAPGAACRAAVEPTGAVAVNLDAVTSTTTHRVKYTHHVDGRAHFSGDGKVYTRIINQARRLDEDIPYMFTMSLQGLDQFAPLTRVKTRYTPSRFTLDGYRDHPRLEITGRWFAQPSDLVDNMANPVDLEVDGVRISDGLALAAPAGSPLADGVLVMNGSLEDDLAVAADSLLLFMGGFSPGLGHGTVGSLVMLTYPDIAEAIARPSLDYSPGTLVER